MKGLPEPWLSIVQGAGIGAALGGGMAAAGYYVRQSKKQVVDLKIPAASIMKNRELALLMNKFTPLRDMNDRTRSLYDTMVVSCNHVVDADMRSAKGSETYQASRSALQTIASAKALCREAAKLTQRGAKCEADPYEVMRDIEAVEGAVNNHLHNIMLQ